MSLDLDKLLGDLSAPINMKADAESTHHEPYLERMSNALEKPRGIALDCGSNEAAVSLRWRFYNARRWVRRKRHIQSYDDLILKVRGNEVLLIPGPKTQVRDL